MDKITIQALFPKPNRSESVSCWISKEISDQLDKISNETGVSKQRITDFLLKKAIAAVEILENEI